MAFSTIASLAGSAISTITEWAGSAIVGEVLTMGFSYLRDRVLPANSEAELNRLQTALPEIKSVMGIAEALKEKDPSTSEWIEQFRQAVEAFEDVLDELEYKELEDMVNTRDEAGGSTSSLNKKKVSALNDDMLERLKKALTMLDQAASKSEHLLQLPETTSFLTETKVFGREVEKEKIIGWLKRPTDARLSSFGIVGVGGLGKTTLAQFAYQEMHGSNHFDKTIWVCVSTNFNVEDITIKMLGELGESSFSGKPLNALQETLKEKIHSRKLLIILDDLWDDEKMSEWEQLVAPLRFVQQGSKILFTTRMKTVADLLKSVIRTEHESLAIQGLEEQELRLLFESYAFHGFNLYNYRDLRAIGDQILTMLRGSPLAAKVIGSLLNSCMDKQYRRRDLNQGSLLNLTEFPTLLTLSQTEFRIKNVGLSSLPEYYQSPDSSSGPSTSSLKIVEIENCQNIRSLNGFLQQDNINFPAIKELTIRCCKRLVHLPAHGFGKLTSLKYLKIMDCPNLTEFLTLLPLSVTKFRIENVGLSGLPEYYQTPDSSSGPSTSSLKILEIENCQNLRSLNGFLQQDNIDFQSIREIDVRNCENLVHLPMDAFGKFESLHKLTIRDCPMLMAVDKQSTFLPKALKYLSIKNWGKVDEPLLELASSLPTLTDLWICDCANISRIPSSENAFKSLNVLGISGCKKLVEHSSREQAHGADRGSSLASLKIKRLFIDNLSLLLIEPLRSLRFVSKLEVCDCSWMEDLPEQWFMQNSSTLKCLTLFNVINLNTLSAIMMRLTVLEKLTIFDANLLEELPKLPTSLRELYISKAYSLKSLPATMARLTVLEELTIYGSYLLEELPELPTSLKYKKIDGRGGRML